MLLQTAQAANQNGDGEALNAAAPILTLLAQSESQNTTDGEAQHTTATNESKANTSTSNARPATTQSQPVFYLAPLVMPLLPGSQASSSTTNTNTSIATLNQTQVSSSPSSSSPTTTTTATSNSIQPQLIPIQSLLSDAQAKIKLEQLISPEALKLLDQSSDNVKCTWKFDLKQGPILNSPVASSQVSSDGSMLLVNTSDDEKRSKRKRQVFSGFQTEELEKAFQVSPYISAVERENLAQKISLSADQVKVWFQNRRTKKYRSSWRKAKQDGSQVAMDNSGFDSS